MVPAVQSGSRIWILLVVASILPVAVLSWPGRLQAGPNADVTLPMHAVIGGSGCNIADPCSPGPPTVNVPAATLVTVYLLMRHGAEVAAVQTAFEWESGWIYQGASWMCQGHQIVGVAPSGNGGPVEGTIATAFDCVTGPGTHVIGTMGFMTGSAGCIQQVESAYPFGTHVVSCSGVVDQVPATGRGSICVEAGGVDACAEAPPEPPVCDAGGPYSAPVAVPFELDGSGSYDPGGSIVSYDWEFGDGSTGAGVRPTHVWESVSTFTVTLCVTDDDLMESCCATQLTTTDENFPPYCDHGGPYGGEPGEAILFDASGSVDLDGTIIVYDWEFGDGAHASGAVMAHAYAANGVYTVTLCVTDDDLAESCCATTASISDETFPPICDAGGPYTGMAMLPVTLDGRGSSDPDGTIVSYVWEFGDGATGAGVTAIHSYTAAGVFTVTLSVTDDDMLESCCSTTASIAELPPPNDVNVGLVLHAIETQFGPCTPPTPPCPLPATSVEVGSPVAVYLAVDNVESIAGVQTAFDFGSFLFMFGLWDCQSGQVNGTTPSGSGPIQGTIATAFECITGPATVVIGRMHFLVEGIGCVTQPQSSFPFGNHIVDCLNEVTRITSPTCLGSVCAGTYGVNPCGDCASTAVEATTWGAIKHHYRGR